MEGGTNFLEKFFRKQLCTVTMNLKKEQSEYHHILVLSKELCLNNYIFCLYLVTVIFKWYMHHVMPKEKKIENA